MAQYISLAGRRFPVPGSRSARIAVGSALVGGGILGFLPVLGFWMLPLGLLVLSVDLPPVRRWRRRLDVRFGRWRARQGDAPYFSRLREPGRLFTCLAGKRRQSHGVKDDRTAQASPASVTDGER